MHTYTHEHTLHPSYKIYQNCSTVQSCSPNLLGGLDILPEEVTFSLGFVAAKGVSELVVFVSLFELVSELLSSVFLRH